MKNILTLAALACAFACSAANAATISILPAPLNPEGIYSLYLQGGADNGNFDAVQVNMLGDFIAQNPGSSLGMPRPAGQAFSYRNRYLDLDPTDPDVPGGLGWSILGAVSNATELSFGGGPLGLKISTPAGDGLFLANVNMPTGMGTASVQLVNGGANVGSALTVEFGIPEPASLGLAGLALIGFAGLRRRLA